MKNSIVYIDSHSLDPYFNFGLEYYLTTEKVFADATVLLFWRTYPTLMVGRYQNTLEEINQDYVIEKEIALVRRMSGGGTIYTDLGGWQYSFITKREDQEIQFQEYTGPIISALREMGVDAEFNGRNDLLIAGRKFSGTAQYMHNGFTVHHGSLLYSTDFGEMERSTRVSGYKIASKGIKSVRDRVTNLADHLENHVSSQEFKDFMVRSLMGESGQVYSLTPEDIKKIQRIAEEKFQSQASIYGKNPKCSLVKTGHFQGGTMNVCLNIHKGKITEAGIYGDFFGSLDKSLLEEELVGCEYCRDTIRAVLKRLDVGNKLYEIETEELLHMIV